MADNIKIRVGKFVLPVRQGTDADGTPRRFVGHPVRSGKLVYDQFSSAVRLASQVLDENPDVLAQVRPLNARLFAVAVARRVRE